jgi:hypothetical protein
MDPVQAGQQCVRSWAQAFPLSGDVLQRIVTSWFRDGQFGLVNIQGVSRNPEMEERIVSQVAGYGRQLGRLLEAVDALAKHRPTGLEPEQITALDALERLAAQVERVKDETAADQSDKIVEDVRALTRNRTDNAATLRRIRDVLDD